MAERKTMRDYIIEAKLDAIIAKLEILQRQCEIYTSLPCEHCDLVGHESEECPTRSIWDDGEIVHNGEQHDPHPPKRDINYIPPFLRRWSQEQHDPHPFKRDINYIPPCLRRWCPKQAEEPYVNETLTTLNQNTHTLSSQKPLDSISTHVEPKQEEEHENVTLISGVDVSEELKHEDQVSIENEKALTEESNDEEQDLVVLNMEEIKESPIILGQTILTIGDVVIEVHKGKVNLRCGKEDDVLKALNSVENFSHFISSYFDNVVIHNSFSDLRMQDFLEKFPILQDPSIMVDIVKIKISLYFQAHPPHRERKNNVNHMVRKLRRGNALKVKFALGEPPD
ncbi:unnamed protein product [Trifolium pratense]|uniref:Uncharacterized protein n=1 Tax=Trifolium pratense TaxID=57577 RepID=A0ACB0LVZ7_TRIPR|nr:unnamed protein product [Trifolium pratense]